MASDCRLIFTRQSSFQPYHKAKHLKECFQLLNLQEGCSKIEAKEAFFQLAKQYHPDGSAKTSNHQTFSQIKEAYQAVCEHLKKQDEANFVHDIENEEDENDLKHTAPQHRQYLGYEGIGTGTPVQRQKQYQSFRAMRAANLAMDHKVEKMAYQDVSDSVNALIVKDKKAAQKIKTTNTLDRMVEDMVQKSMANGDFDNLPGSGKPLPSRTNYCPFIDISQHNLNQVLVNNGYVPEWIRLDREIKSNLQDLKDALLNERLKLGREPFNKFNENKWKDLLKSFEVDIRNLNKQIDHLNLIVPIIRLQMVHFKAQKEISKVLHEYDEVKPQEKQESTSSTDTSAGHGILYRLLEKLSEGIVNKIMPS